ncbi:MAG TPA: glycosyltransferase family 4 protein [bacterium]
MSTRKNLSRSLKKVLIVTYYFPPAGGAGVQRTLKFVKYLRDFGWEPVVLTARNADYPAYDPSLEAEIPEGVKVYRSGIFEPYWFYRKLTGRGADESTDIATLTLDNARQRKLGERVSEWVRAAVFVPDARIGWYAFANRVGKRVAEKEKIDVILSSAPPYTTHLIGLRLHRATGLPWVADFRDSWIGWVSAPQWRPKLSRALEWRMERAVLQKADTIITVSRGVEDDLLGRHPQLRDGRWRFLPNGYDAADFHGVTPAPRGNKIVITYAGSMYGARNPEYLLQALELLQKDQPQVVDRLRVRLVGRIGEPIAARMRSSSVYHIFEMVPYVTHRESLSYLLGSDVLLLIIDDAPASSGILTGKLYEYIGAGKPILALAPEGEAADLIRKYKLGWAVPPKDSAAILKVLHEIVDHRGREKEPPQVGGALGTRFERRNQTGELARILDELIGAQRA